MADAVAVLHVGSRGQQVGAGEMQPLPPARHAAEIRPETPASRRLHAQALEECGLGGARTRGGEAPQDLGRNRRAPFRRQMIQYLSHRQQKVVRAATVEDLAPVQAAALDVQQLGDVVPPQETGTLMVQHQVRTEVEEEGLGPERRRGEAAERLHASAVPEPLHRELPLVEWGVEQAPMHIKVDAHRAGLRERHRVLVLRQRA